MRSRTILTTLAAAAALAAAGCGDDDKPATAKATTTPSTPVRSSAADLAKEAEKPASSDKPATPEASWANKLCTGLAESATELQPPNVKSPDPQEAKKELIRFFTDVTDQLERQQKVIKTVGKPPESAEVAGWTKAKAGLAETQAKVAKIRQGIRSQDFSSKAAAQKNLDQLGKDFAVLNTYLGPVAELKKDKGLQTAIEAEPACAKVS